MLAQTLLTITTMLTALLVTDMEPEVAGADPGVLSIRMSGFRNSAGQVLVAIYRGPDGFPAQPGKAWKTAVAEITGGRARVDVPTPPGEYAFAVVHDENGNNAMDTNWLGIPREGHAASNNAKGRFGPPKYRDARFSVGEAGAVQPIAITYL